MVPGPSFEDPGSGSFFDYFPATCTCACSAEGVWTSVVNWKDAVHSRSNEPGQFD